MFQAAWHEMVTGGKKAEEAAAQALNQAKEIFAKYPL